MIDQLLRSAFVHKVWDSERRSPPSVIPVLNVRTMRYYSCDKWWKIKTTMMDVSLMISDIANFRMN